MSKGLEVVLQKRPDSLWIPADDASLAVLQGFYPGEGLRATIKRERNLARHRRFFKLLQIAFDVWEPATGTHRGMPVVKNLERFRKDILIAAGFYEPVVNLKGEVRAEAKSMNFASMDEAEFRQVYARVLDVVWERVLRDYGRYASREEVERVAQQLLQFGGGY